MPESQDTFPLSHAQAGIWFSDQLDPGNPAYNITTGWRITGPLDTAALARAYQSLVDRHEMLRIGVRLVDETPCQQVHKTIPAAMETADLTALTSTGQAEHIAQCGRQELSRRFDLAVPPLIRARLLVLAEQEHYLLLTVHHIAADGWSLSILLDTLLATYAAERAGEAPHPAAADHVQYRDYVRWQQETLQGPERDRLIHYWRTALEGAPTVELPSDRKRPTRPGSDGAVLEFDIPRELTAALKDLARRHRATLFMVIVAGMQALMRRYTGQQDITVGVPVSHRPHSKYENLAGLFLNTLPLRVSLPGHPTFAQLLERTREAAFDGYAHADLPFEVIVNELGVSLDASRKPLVQVLVTFQNGPAADTGAAGLRLRAEPVDSGYAKVDLDLNLAEADGRLSGVLCYATSLFDRDRMVRLRAHLIALLAGAVEDPDRPIGSIPLLGPDEQKLIAKANATSRSYGPRLLPELIAEQVRRTPERPAVIGEQEHLDYGAFGARINRLARRLHQAGVGRGDVVGVCLSRGVDLVVAVHAVQAAGAAYLPLEPDYPAARLRLLLDDTSCAALVTTAELAGVLGKQGSRPVIRLDEDRPSIDEQDPAPLGVSVSAEDLAYVIYTSGSTGRPKAVAVSHGAVTNRIRWMQETFALTPDDRVLHKTPFSFDVSVWELFWPFLAGAALVVARPDGHRDPEYLAELMAQERVSTVHFVPSMADVFLNTPGIGADLRWLRLLFCSGEGLPVSLAQRMARILPGTAVHNLYGPTEAAIDVSWQPCGGAENDGAPGGVGPSFVPLGLPVANTRLEVVDAELQRLPVGVPGELCIAGVQLAHGYLNQPGMTADRFRPDPYGPPGSRLYRTGDQARRLADGRVEFLGRLDHQVKLNGLRIEPGEIEAALDSQPEVRTSVAVVRQDSRTAALTLVAYLVPQPDRRTAAEKIDWARRLRGLLPSFLVPSAYVVLDTLPTTVNGKLDRSALPAPDARSAAQDEQPRTAAEEALVHAWQGCLGLTRVGIQDNFFAVGGDSMRAIAAVSRLRRAGWQVSLADVLAHPVVADLAVVMRYTGQAADATDAGQRTEPFALLSEKDRQLFAH